MPFLIDGKIVYRIGEALAKASLSRATYFRWIRQGRIRDTHYKDRNGRRVFTEEELEDLRQVAGRLIEAPQLKIPLELG